MRKYQEREIDGIFWTVQQFPTGEGLKLLTKLLKILRPGLNELKINKDFSVKEALNGGISPDMVLRAVGNIIDQMDEDGTMRLIFRLLANTQAKIKNKNGEMEILDVDGNTMDAVIGNKYRLLMKVLAFVVEVNYSDFLAGDEAGETKT